VAAKLDIQKHDAEWWRDACVGYFQTFSRQPLPSEVRPLIIPVDTLMQKLLQSDRLGMPIHDENHNPVLVKPRRRPRP
jgi:alpha-glucuronidase